MVPHTFEKTGKRLFISTSILSLASEYHDRLFNGHMPQVHDIPNRKPVFLNLNEEDLQALEVILRAFHYQMTAPLTNLDSSLITKIALHTDKYYTRDMLETWVTTVYVYLRHQVRSIT
jgi:hypothetical protein